MLKVEVVDSLPAFQQLKKEWEILLKKSSHPHIFLTWDWLFCWWKYFGENKRLYTLLAKADQGLLVGIAPLFITTEKWGLRNLKVVKFLGTHPISSEYLDLICEQRDSLAVAKSIVSHLTSQKGVDLIYFSDLRENSPLLEHLPGVDILSPEIQLGETCPLINFPGEWETFLKSVNRRVREYVRSNWKFFIQEKKGVLEKADWSNYEQVLAELFRLHSARWKAKGRAGSFARPEKRDFHGEICQRLLEKNQLGLYYLTVEQKIISVLYGFVYGDTYYYYQTGFDQSYQGKRPGLLVLYHAMEQGFKSGLKHFDFLRGEEEYKLKWANSQNKTFQILIPLSKKAKSALRTRRTYSELKRKLKGILKKTV